MNHNMKCSSTIISFKKQNIVGIWQSENCQAFMTKVIFTLNVISTNIQHIQRQREGILKNLCKKYRRTVTTSRKPQYLKLQPDYNINLVIAFTEEFKFLIFHVHENTIKMTSLSRTNLDRFTAPSEYLSCTNVSYRKQLTQELTQTQYLVVNIVLFTFFHYNNLCF